MTSNGIICNGVENPFQSPVSKVVIPVKAGDQITAEWHHTLDGADPSDPADPVDPSHKGAQRLPSYPYPRTSYSQCFALFIGPVMSYL